jgi:sugar phosphate isomerase/epimerase
MNASAPSTRRDFIKVTAGAAAVAAAGPLAEKTAHAAEVKHRPYKISCAAYSYRKYLPHDDSKGSMTILDFVDQCAAWGLEGCEPTTYYFTQTDRPFLHQLKKRAFMQGVDISGTAVGNNFCLPPGDELNKEIQGVKDWIDRAVEFGAPVIRIFGGHQNKNLEREKAFAYAVDGMKRVSDYAGDKGVLLGIENHGYLTERGDDLLRIINAVDHEWLGINLDTGNFHDYPYDNMAKVAKYAVNVQVKIELRTDDGKGKSPADFPRIVAILRNAGYKGYLVLEYEGAKEPKDDIPGYLAALRNAAYA